MIEPAREAFPSLAVGIPPPSPTSRELPFLGRRRELQRVLGLLRAAAGGRPGGLLLLGSDGSGKSRLLDRARVLAEREGFEVRLLSLGEWASEPPSLWLPQGSPNWREGTLLLPPELLSREPAERTEPLPRSSAAERSGSTDAPSATRRLAPATTQQQLRELREVAAEHPLLVLVDDFELVDRGTVLLVDRLLRGSGGDHFAVLLTADASSLGAVPVRSEAVQWLDRNAASGRVISLELAPLPLESASVLTREFLGGAKLTAEASRRLEELFLRLGGNPGQFLESLRRLTHHGLVRLGKAPGGRISIGPGASSGDLVAGYFPPGLRSSLSGRLARLTPSELSLLGTGAMFGSEFPLEPVADAVGLEMRTALERLEHLEESSGLVRPAGAPQRWRLDPPAIAELLPRLLGPSDRSALASRLAHWWELHAPKESRQVARLYRLAGEAPRSAAWARRALRDALERRAFEELPQMAAELAESLSADGRVDRAHLPEYFSLYVELRSETADAPSAELLRWLRAHADGPEAELDVEPYLADVELITDVFVARRRLEELERRLAEGEGPLSEPAQAVADLVRAYLLCAEGRPSRAARAAGHAAATLARTGDGFHAAFGYQLQGWSLGSTGHTEAARRAVRRGRKVAARHGLTHKSIGLALLLTESLTEADSGRLEESVAMLRAGLPVVESLDSPRSLAQCRVNLALLLLEVQAPAEAFEQAELGCRYASGAGSAVLLAQGLLSMAIARARQRRWSDCLAIVEEIHRALERGPVPWTIPLAELLRCRSEAELGRSAEAVQRLARLAPESSAALPPLVASLQRPMYLITRARVLELSGNLAEAAREYRSAYREGSAGHLVGTNLEALDGMERLAAPLDAERAARYRARRESICRRHSIHCPPFIGPADSPGQDSVPAGAPGPSPAELPRRLLAHLQSVQRGRTGGEGLPTPTASTERGIALALRVPRDRFAQSLRRLEQRGLVRRERRRPKGARRSVFVYLLTAEGQLAAAETPARSPHSNERQR
ncbi:MAG: AAA family ATPase [Thermoplasmata archaeon]|nr:AAA family ATPase [Thermoplasmata archaeon]